MGYYTDHTINWTNKDGTGFVFLEEIEKAFVLNTTLQDDDDVSFFLQGNTLEAKWYNRSQDMTIISRQFPDTLFTVRGWGEEHDDVWVEYWTNGKVQREVMPEWTPPLFDPDKLKERNVK